MRMPVYNRSRELRFETVSNDNRRWPEANIQLPKRSTSGAGAYDFFAPASVIIPPRSQLMLWTDVKAQMPPSLVLMLNVRSSMGKHHIRLANTIGWVDCDYYSNSSNDGNIGLLLENNSDQPFCIEEGDRVAQGMFVRFYVTEDDYVATERTGGFGSTGN